MSRLTGKCDFYDFITMRDGLDLKKCRIEQGGKILNLEQKDLCLYYPFIIGIMATDSENTYIMFSEKSHITAEEQSTLEMYLRILKKEYRRCKRKKEPFLNKENVPFYRPYIDELYERVKKDGEKATIDGIKTPIADHYRSDWKKEILKNGFSEQFADKWIAEH